MRIVVALQVLVMEDDFVIDTGVLTRTLNVLTACPVRVKLIQRGMQGRQMAANDSANMSTGQTLHPTTVYLDEGLVFLNLSASDSDDVILTLAEALRSCGAVKAEYGAAACERERKFPTGLPTLGVYVAIPHADAEHVNYTAIATARCTPAVAFGNMADPEEKLPVELVIMAAVADGSQQVKMLQRLADAFGEPETLLGLKAAETPREVVQILKEKVLSDADREPELDASPD